MANERPMKRRVFNRAGGVAGGCIGGRRGSAYVPPITPDDRNTRKLEDMDDEEREAFRSVYGFVPKNVFLLMPPAQSWDDSDG